MPITFDTLDELKAFYRSFRLEDAVASNGQSQRQKTAAVAVEIEHAAPTSTKGRRGRKPGKGMAKIVKPKRDKSNSLTAKIQESITKALNHQQSFTANDIYADLAKKDGSINKQSVITSVLKQMNSTFKHISVTERPGNGPRPVKLYNA